MGRRIVGLVAAYALALQAILAVGPTLSVAGHQSWLDLCVSQSGEPAPAVPSHQTDQQCCVAMASQGWPGIAPQGVATVLLRYAEAVRAADRSAPELSRVVAARPNWPRAPPA